MLLLLMATVDDRVVRRGATGDRTGRFFVFGENVPYLGTTAAGPGRLWRRDGRRRGRGPVAFHGFRCTSLELLQKVIDLDFYRVGRTGHVLPLPSPSAYYNFFLPPGTIRVTTHFLGKGCCVSSIVLHLLPLHRFLYGHLFVVRSSQPARRTHVHHLLLIAFPFHRCFFLQLLHFPNSN
uniref:(northern house mosquito) hypothetical protein n=1 Tax=Culex pipiens TaxID=7175 RepID=A0A8D8C2C5_CULPI